MALTSEMLRSELEAFAEQTLQNHLNRLESRLLQGIHKEMQNLNVTGQPSMALVPMQKHLPALQFQGKADTFGLPHPLPPGGMNDEDEGNFHYLGNWAQALERDPHGVQQSHGQSRSPRAHAPDKSHPQASKAKARKTARIRLSGPPPEDMEAIEPLRTYVVAAELEEIEKAQNQDQKVRRFASRKSMKVWTRRTTVNIFSKVDIGSKSQDASKKKLQAAGRASSGDRISTLSFDSAIREDAAGEASAALNKDEKGESTFATLDSFQMAKPSQLVMAEEHVNGHLDHQFSFEDDEEPLYEKCHACISVIVIHPFFDYASALFIFLNAISIGLQTDWFAENYMKSVPEEYRIVDYCFCCVFTLELVLRLYVFGMSFFLCTEWKWNVFDTVLVGMQLTEEILNLVSSKMQALNFSFMRVLRILRLVRIVRLFRVVRVITELRTIVSSIAGCMKSLFSTLVLLLLMIYVVGVFFTQLVSDHYASKDDQSRVADLDLYYASLSRSILSLFCAMSGGVDWENMVNPLIVNISPVLAGVFSMYIAFAVLAMMNVVTGVFVESALLSAKEDKDIYMVNHMRALLKSTDVDSSGTITWEEFKDQLVNPQMVELFRSIDVDIREARGLFDLLDMNDVGKITTDQFVTGCLRLRGTAKALDLSLLIHEQRRISKRTFSHIRYVESLLTYLCESIGHVDPGNPSAVLKGGHEFEV